MVLGNISLDWASSFKYLGINFFSGQRRSQGGGRDGRPPPIGDPSNFLIYEIDSFLLTTAPLVCLFNWQSDIQI